MEKPEGKSNSSCDPGPADRPGRFTLCVSFVTTFLTSMRTLRNKFLLGKNWKIYFPPRVFFDFFRPKIDIFNVFRAVLGTRDHENRDPPPWQITLSCIKDLFFGPFPSWLLGFSLVDGPL